MMKRPFGSEMTLDIENGTDLCLRIATPRDLLEKEEWYSWPTQSLLIFTWSAIGEVSFLNESYFCV